VDVQHGYGAPMSAASSVFRSVDRDEIWVLRGGEYWIGDNAIARSGPRHVRRFSSASWIEARYTPYAAFREFVSAGGYEESRLWQTAVGVPFPASALPASVDERCEEIRGLTLTGLRGGGRHGETAKRVPVCGLTWFEASAVCHFFGGRLPFEAEWEAAMIQGGLGQPGATVKICQEWTGDGWFNRYWRADGDCRGRLWVGGEVVVRGHAADEPAFAVAARRGFEPTSGTAFRGFRRAWDQRP
jgi:hypothetical protein